MSVSLPTLPKVGDMVNDERIVVHMVDRKPVESVVKLHVRITEEPRTINGTTYAKSEIVESTHPNLMGRGHLVVFA
jgi:hypothetical protein